MLLSFDKIKSITKGAVDFKEENGYYSRYDESQRERMYPLEAVKKKLRACGFEFIGAYSDYDFSSGDTYMIGNIKFIWTEFLCAACGKTYSLQEINEIEKKAK